MSLKRKLARHGKPYLSNPGRKDLVERCKGKIQWQIASMLEVDPTHFSRILRGERLPTHAQATRIEEKLGTPASLWVC